MDSLVAYTPPDIAFLPKEFQNLDKDSTYFTSALALIVISYNTNLVTTPPKQGRALPLALSQQDQSILIFITSVLMPGLMVFGGVVAWWRRRMFS